MAQTVKFTEARVAALRQSVKAGRVEFKDEEIPGLLLRVTPTSASWSLVKRLPGSGVTRVSLGKADAVSVTEARKLARIRIGEMHQGIDPNAVKRQKRAAAQREGLTLGEGLAIYLAERDQLRPATKVTYERDLRTTFGDYWDRPLIELTPERVRDRQGVGKNLMNAGAARASGLTGSADAYSQLAGGLGGMLNNWYQGNKAANPGGTGWYFGNNPGRG